MALCKNHDYIYFDTLRRVNKAETVLSLIMASHHVKSENEEERKSEIAKNLVYAYNLFLGKSGSYTGTKDQFASQYTIGHELGIWTNSKLELNQYALRVAQNKITIKDYFDRIFLNYFQPINHVLFHPLFHILTYLIDNKKNFISKDEITEYVTKITKSTLAHDKKLEGTNSLYNMFLATNYFTANETNDGLIYVSNLRKEFLREKCDISYLEKGYAAAEVDFKELENYVAYLIHEKYVKEQKEGDKKMPETKPFENYEYKAIDNNTEKKFNRIIFGAPGTGKSYQINEAKDDLSAMAEFERVTFHPNYSYAQFVGTYKPVTKDDGDIAYKYVEGPFMRLLTAALENAKDSNKQNRKRYLLIVEEINRANVAAVFGDMFQLLDRDTDGVSDYEIQTSEDVRKYLASKLGGDGSEDKYKTLKLPNNFYIWATMNSADQGVQPMDAAFKRRWNFEYLNIDSGKFDVKIPIPNGATEVNGEMKVTSWVDVEWDTLRTAINDTLKKIPGVNEDKLLGPFFIGNEDKINALKEDNNQFNELFKSKVLMYLFEDVVKMNPSDLFNRKEGENVHYSDICKEFDQKGLKIFVKSICNKFDAFKSGEEN